MTAKRIQSETVPFAHVDPASRNPPYFEISRFQGPRKKYTPRQESVEPPNHPMEHFEESAMNPTMQSRSHVQESGVVPYTQYPPANRIH